MFAVDGTVESFADWISGTVLILGWMPGTPSMPLAISIASDFVAPPVE